MTKRHIILYIATSLDGYIAKTNGDISWLEDFPTPTEPDNSYDVMYETIDTVIMGRTTYEQVTQELAPNHYPYHDKKTIVVTSKKERSSESITFINEPIVDYLRSLKELPGKNIWIVGGNSVIQPLMEANLIDDYQIATLPIILGEGIPLFRPHHQHFKLVPKSTKLINHIIYQTYIKRA